MFLGRDGDECEGFIIAVTQKMFAEGKQMDVDDKYIAHFAGTKMKKKALRWFSTLDDDAQNSWKLLRKALLEKYPSLPSDEDAAG